SRPGRFGGTPGPRTPFPSLSPLCFLPSSPSAWIVKYVVSSKVPAEKALRFQPFEARFFPRITSLPVSSCAELCPILRVVPAPACALLSAARLHFAYPRARAQDTANPVSFCLLARGCRSLARHPVSSCVPPPRHPPAPESCLVLRVRREGFYPPPVARRLS